MCLLLKLYYSVMYMAVLYDAFAASAGVSMLMNYKYQTCLVVEGSSMANNAALNLTGCHCPSPLVPFSIQVWSEQWWAIGTTYYTVANAITSKCVTVNSGSTADGATVDQYTCENADNQKWRVYNGVYSGAFQIRNLQTGKCMTAEGSGTRIEQWDCGTGTTTASSPHHFWRIIQYG